MTLPLLQLRDMFLEIGLSDDQRCPLWPFIPLLAVQS